jgi:hypothetical protein
VIRVRSGQPGWLVTTTQRECWRVMQTAVNPIANGQGLENTPDEQIPAAEHGVLAPEIRKLP